MVSSFPSPSYMHEQTEPSLMYPTPSNHEPIPRTDLPYPNSPPLYEEQPPPLKNEVQGNDPAYDVEKDTKEYQTRRFKRRRLYCYVCGCLLLLVLVILISVFIFLFAIFKKPVFVFQGIQPSTSESSLLHSTHQGTLQLNIELTYFVTNPNGFEFELYDIELRTYANRSKQEQVGNGTLPFLKLIPGRQAVHIPLTFYLKLPSLPFMTLSPFTQQVFQACLPSSSSSLSPSLESTSSNKEALKLYYEVEAGVELLKFTGYKYRLNGEETVTCPLDLTNLLQSNPMPSWVPNLIQFFPTLAKFIPSISSTSQLGAIFNSPPIQDFIQKSKGVLL